MKKSILLLLFYLILIQTKSTAQSVQLSDSAITSRLYYSGLYMDKFVKGYYNGLAIAATGSFISILSQVVYPPKLDNSLYDMNRADRIAMINVGGLISLTGIAINILSVRHVHQSAKLLRSIDPVKDQPKMLPIGC